MKLNPTMFRRCARFDKIGAFTLIESIVVIAVLLALMVLVVPAISPLKDGILLTQAGQMVADQILFARQNATARNRPMEIRFIGVATDGGYDAIQIWNTDAKGISSPVTKLTALPESMVISKNTDVSPLFNALSEGTMDVNNLTERKFRTIKIRPSGIVEPVVATDKRSDLSIMILIDRFATENTAPANYAIIQIDPISGNVLLYRP